MSFMPPRHGKCLAIGTPVLMADGTWKPIELVCPSDMVMSVNLRYDVTSRCVTSTMNNGVRPVLKITLFSGRELVCTENHPLLTVSGWVNAGDLKIGDSVAAAKRSPMSSGDPLPWGFASLMGYIAGDGGYTNGEVRITNIDPDVIRHLGEIAERYGWKLTWSDITCNIVNAVRGQGDSARKRMAEYLVRASAHAKRVPDCIWNANADDLAAYLAAYFMCDGTVTTCREGVAEFYSVSSGLLRDVQKLLTRFGIYSTLRSKTGRYKGKPHLSWRLGVSGGDLVEFARHVPVIGAKGDKLRALASVVEAKSHYPRYDAIPPGWKAFVRNGVGWHRGHSGIRVDKNYTQGTARHIVRKIAEIEDNDDLRRLCNPDIIWEAIVNIEPIGDLPTYDIEVDETHNFVADGMVVHNSEHNSIRYAAYRLELDPALRELLVCHSQPLATKFSRDIRKIVSRRVEMNRDKRGAKEWETRAGGGLVAVGVGGVGGGIGANLTIMDDLVKNQKVAQSETFRTNLYETYLKDIKTRRAPGAAQLLTYTRWHQQDIGGQILASEEAKDWVVIRLPALAEADDPLGRPEGMALWPERWDRFYLLKMLATDPYGFGALYQQNPTPPSGDMFEADWFIDPYCYVNGVPHDAQYVRYWDKAGKETGSGARTAGVLMAKTARGLYIVCDVVAGRWKAGKREEMIKATAQMDGPNVQIWVEQEPGSGGLESAENTIINLAGYNVRKEPVRGDKALRAMPMSAQASVGNVKLLRDGPGRRWNREFIQELLNFPQGLLKDQVDASAGAFNKLALKPTTYAPEVSGPRLGIAHDLSQLNAIDPRLWKGIY